MKRKKKDLRIDYSEALEKFQDILIRLHAGATPVYEVRSYPINNLSGIKVALSSVRHGAVVWQHTDKWHTCAIYIEQGKGINYSREYLDLIATGVDNKEKFKEAWREKNGNKLKGFFPKPSYSKTSASRRYQKSYIVADRSHENKNSHIKGSFKENLTHRTHLISARTTGIENHKGLLIDYDSWLNMVPMNKFEEQVLKKTQDMDIIWTTTVTIVANGLHLQYMIYNRNFELILKAGWTDDRWTYFWYIDKGQTKLSSN